MGPASAAARRLHRFENRGPPGTQRLRVELYCRDGGAGLRRQAVEVRGGRA